MYSSNPDDLFECDGLGFGNTETSTPTGAISTPTGVTETSTPTGATHTFAAYTATATPSAPTPSPNVSTSTTPSGTIISISISPICTAYHRALCQCD